MAAVYRFVFVIATYSINLRVKKCSFVTSDFIGLTLTGMEAERVTCGDTFIWASLWQVRDGKFLFRLRSSSQGFDQIWSDQINILIDMCGGVECCPGLDNPRRGISEISTLICRKSIKMFHQNVRGLLANHLDKSTLLQNFPRIDILSMSETHIVVRNEH